MILSTWAPATGVALPPFLKKKGLGDGLESTAVLKFSGHRLRPAVDLLMRIPDFPVRSVADLGAGAGNVTKLIKERWPDAVVVGVEGSAEMVAAGKKAAPEVEWLHQDLGVWQPAQQYDVIYSNAALHWLPDHESLFPSLMAKVEPGGIFAVQMPRNFGAPSHVADRRDRAERAVAQPTRASRHAAAGAGTRLLSRPADAVVAKHRYLGDRVSAGSGRRQSGQGMDQGHLADPLSRRPRRATKKRPSRPPMASGSRKPIRGTRRGQTLFPFRRLFMVAQRKA